MQPGVGVPGFFTLGDVAAQLAGDFFVSTVLSQTVAEKQRVVNQCFGTRNIPCSSLFSVHSSLDSFGHYKISSQDIIVWFATRNSRDSCSCAVVGRFVQGFLIALIIAWSL